MPFASTERLNLREQRESDNDRLFAMMNDVSQMRVGPNYVRPRGPSFRKVLSSMPDEALLWAIVEAKEPLNPDTISDDNREDELFVGFVELQMKLPKNRDASFGIALDSRWWNRGFGTEVIRWVVDYGFENLGLHRISLVVMGDNLRAISLYKTV
jgi:RimJ/RimL family protein N-acetyltransferase